MSQKEKLIRKLKSHPRDFTFDDAETLLGFFSYKKYEKGRTSGSRIVFVNELNNKKILLHKPHPKKELLAYQVAQLLEHLEKEGLI